MIGRDALQKLAECRHLLLLAVPDLRSHLPCRLHQSGGRREEGLRPGCVDSILFRLRRALGGNGVVIRCRASRSEQEAEREPGVALRRYPIAPRPASRRTTIPGEISASGWLPYSREIP